MFMKILLIMAAACAVDTFPSNSEYQRTTLGDSIDKASMKLLNEMYKNASDKNVVASPLGVMLLLSMYSGGAGPKSMEQISQFLGGGDNKQITESYSYLSRRLAQEDPSYLTVANKIYVSKKFSIANAFSAITRSYESEAETIDFADNVAAAAIINHWADEKTQGHINTPVDPKILDKDTVSVLVNVIFFQGHWHVPFQANETQEKDFYVDKTTTVKKPMMHLTKSLFYTENQEIGARMIELPYKEYGFRMIVVLPNEVDGLPKVLEKVAETGLLTDVFNMHPPNCKIDLDIPKFEVKNKIELNDILPQVGVSEIFNEGAPGIVKDKPVKVSKAFQEAFIKVDEEGAVAGAFTGYVQIPMSSDSTPPPPMSFKVDHPFMYMILHEDKVIFTGAYTH